MRELNYIELHESNWKLDDWNNQLLWQFAISFHSRRTLWMQWSHKYRITGTTTATTTTYVKEGTFVWLSVWHSNYPLSGCNWTTAKPKRRRVNTHSHTYLLVNKWQRWLWLRFFRLQQQPQLGRGRKCCQITYWHNKSGQNAEGRQRQRLWVQHLALTSIEWLICMGIKCNQLATPIASWI